MKKRIKYISDFETSTGNDDKSTNIYLWGIKSLDKSETYSGVNLEEFFECILYYELDKIFFHNLKWDGKFIVHWLIENGLKFSNIGFNDRLNINRFTWIQSDMGVMYSLTVNYLGHIVRFGDTARLLLSTVDKMGKVLGLPKLTIDYHAYKHFNNINEVPKKLIEYLWRDIDVVIDTYLEFLKAYPLHSITLGSTSLIDFKKNYGKYNYVIDFGGKWYDRKTKSYVYNEPITEEFWNFLKTYFFGGLTFYHPKLKGKIIKTKNGQSVDYTSLYPSMQKDKLLPYGKPLKNKPMNTDYVVLYHIHIIEANIKDDTMPPHLHDLKAKGKKGDKYLKHIKDAYYIYTSFEWEELLLTYDIEYDIIDKHYFYAKKVYENWVNDRMALKNNAKSKVEKNYHKGGLNSTYGKSGENIVRAKRIIKFNPEKDMPGVRYGSNRDYVEVKVVENTGRISYIPKAIFITSYARCELIRAVRINKGIFIYGDTDSMYLRDKPVGIKIRDDEFSSWKPELRFKRFKFIKPKAYIAELTHEYVNGEWVKSDKVKIALAGLTKENHKKLNFKNFKKGYCIPNGKVQQKNVKGGVVLVNIKYTL